MLVNVISVGGVAALALFAIGNRVSADDDLTGLDAAEMGAEGYRDDGGRTAVEAAPTGEDRSPVASIESSVSA
jgi:hypothetical protein